jgi:hypothetical protein
MLAMQSLKKHIFMTNKTSKALTSKGLASKQEHTEKGVVSLSECKGQKSLFLCPKLWVLCCLMAFVSLAANVNAQVTTASMSGKVSDANGQPAPGATVVAKHLPSGTEYRIATTGSGNYNFQGMRVGGPYTLEISYVGYQTNTVEGIQLSLGETYVENVKLSQSAITLDVAEVVGSKVSASSKTGATTNISQNTIIEIPTINRSISDLAKLSPYSNGMSFAGGDGRSSNFTVDGANLNNNFGLSANLPGGGNPISLDALEEIQIVITPYDVRQTNFVGGGVNAITKSGTNNFKASAYAYYKNQDMRGNRIGETDFGVRNKESRTILGATLGGPIVKNKLFFFANFEWEKTPQEVITWRASDNGETDGTTTSRVTNADLKLVSDHLKNKYGYNTGSWTDFPADVSNFKYLARLDWNINKNHTLTGRFNYTKNTAWNAPNGNSTDGAYRDYSSNRVGPSSMSYANSMYSMDNIVYSGTLELNSRIGNNMSNKFLVTYTDIKDVRGSTSDPFPFIDIMSGDVEGATGTELLAPYISAGYELFTWNNGVKNQIITATDNFTYYLGSHKLTAGLSYEYQMADNNYMRNGTAYYRYASVSDFLNGAAPVDFALTYGTNGNLIPSNAVKFNTFGAYLQDEWTPSNYFTLSYGLRADMISFVDDIMTNNAVLDLDFGGRKINTGKWPTSKVNFSPRVGFTWDALKNNSLVIRGGTGLFTGRLPLVFFTNMPSNSGMNQILMKLQTVFGENGQPTSVHPDLAKLAGGMITDVDELIKLLGFQTEVTPEDGSLPSSIAGVDPKFRMPQVWKSSFAIDYNVPVSVPLTFSLEGTFTKNINAVMIDNYAVKKPDETWERFEGPDNRYIYPSDYLYYSGTRDACVLTNTNKGYGYTVNFNVNSTPVKNLNLMASYIHTEMKELSGMPGSNANSAWVGIYSVNGQNVPDLQRSQYVIPDKVIASLSYKLQHGNSRLEMPTTISLFYSGYSSAYIGGWYYSGGSYTYSNDVNGDRQGNDLIYIPKKRGEIQFVSNADEDAFFSFMEKDKYLSKHKGQYAEAYSVVAPWLHRFDLRIMQDFTFKIGRTKHTLQASLDILNVGNLIYSKWGVGKSMESSNNGRILEYRDKDALGRPGRFFAMNKYDGKYITDAFMPNNHYSQCWALQLGIKYIF